MPEGTFFFCCFVVFALSMILFCFWCFSNRDSDEKPLKTPPNHEDEEEEEDEKQKKKGGKKRERKRIQRRRRKERRRMHLSDDLVIQILLRLPVKSMLRFRSVCKSWHALLTSPDFISMHFNNYTRSSDSISHLLFNCPTDAPTFSLLSYSLDDDNDDSTMSVLRFDLSPFLNVDVFGPPLLVGTCDGIVCLQGSKPDTIALWNPALREFKILPVSGIPRPVGPLDSEVYKASVGFGFDPETRDYKVVQILRLRPNKPIAFQAEIYSLRANSWRKLDVTVPAKFTWTSWSLASANNRMIFWWAVVKNLGSVILSFDVSTEVFLTTLVPKFDVTIARQHKNPRAILPFDDSFPLIVYTRNGGDSFDIWVTDELGVQDYSWTKLLTLGPFSECYANTPLGFWKNGWFLLHQRSGEVIFYKHDTQDTKSVGIRIRGLLGFSVYKESLVSIHQENVFN